jgi:tetratricopeptide (TPR) repeat protein
MKKAIAGLIIVLMLGSILFIRCVGQAETTSAKMYIQQSNYDKAIEQATLAVEKQPNNPEAYFVLGQAYGHKKMFREMNDAFKKSLEQSEKYAADIDQHLLKYWIDVFNSGVNAIKQDKIDDAIEKFQIATELRPEKIDAYKNLAFAYTQNDQDSMAIEVYLYALKNNPEDLEVKYYLGALYYQAEKYDKSIEILQEVLDKADPNTQIYTDALTNIAYAYDLLGDSDKAIETYKTALEQTPDDKDLIFNMGRLYSIQDKYEDAIASFKKVLELDPQDFESNLNIGNSYISLADSIANDAKKVDERGNSIYSEEEITEKEKLAETHFENAITYLEKAIELQPDNVNAWTLLGIAYVRSGNAEKGQEAFDKAEELKGTE